MALISGRPPRRWSPREREALEGYLFILPWFVGFLVFTAGPLLSSLYLSFTEWGFADTPVFVGLDNYRRILDDPIFEIAVENTATYTLVTVPLVLVVSLVLALLMTRDLSGMHIFRTIYYIPAVIGGVAMALVWSWVFNPDYGILNYLLRSLGLGAPNWLGSPTWAMRAIIVLSVWNIGFPMIVFIAGLQNIPKVLYEAAVLDGAGRWQKFRTVTLPMLTPTLFFLLVTSMISSFQIFDVVYVISQGDGRPLRSTLVYLLYYYQNAFSFFDMGYASALIWVFFLGLMAMTLLVFKFSSLWVFYESEVKNE
ncbi:MAG: carbohydrate ABC transporter permease [Thermomicrobiales bacterium]